MQERLNQLHQPILFDSFDPGHYHPATAQSDLKAKYLKKKLEVRQLKREVECVEGLYARSSEPSRPQLYSNETEVHPVMNVSGDSFRVRCTPATPETV